MPAGTLEPSREVLVGYNGGTNVRIDTTTGVSTNVGPLGGSLASSGDIVSVAGGKTFLTVTGRDCACDGGSCPDCL